MRAFVPLIALLFVPFPATGVSVAAACSDAPIERAARELVHPDAEVVDPAGLVLAPTMHPGVPTRLVLHDGRWCDAARASHVYADRPAVDAASAYVMAAGAPWFAGARVLTANELAPGVVAVTTHALRNGVVVEWTVEIDAAGVRRASWLALDWLVEPYEVDLEGLAAMPGATRTFVRGADGLLALAPLPEPAPAIEVTDTMSDGFRIRFTYGPAGAFYPVTGVEPFPLDVMRAVTRENYEEFLTWGFTKGWSSNLGRVHVDDSTSALCLACVVISTEFQVHISSAILPLVRVLADTHFPDDRAGLATIMGHEMFHNFQNRYYRPTSGNFVIGAFSEGTARMQETLHSYSWVSHQPESLIFKGTANGCNFELAPEPHPFEFPPQSPVQWVATPTLAAGPSTGQTYSACDFWLTWYGHHGADGIRALLPAAEAHKHKSGWLEMLDTIESATGAPIDDDLARFAAAILTHENLAFGPVAGGAPLDWSAYLGRWEPAALAPGEARTERLRDGGMMGARLAAGGIVTTTPADGVALYRVGDDAGLTRLADGDAVGGPAWVVAILPRVGEVDVTLSLA